MTKKLLTESEKIYCIQRATTGTTQHEAYSLAFDVRDVEKNHIAQRACRLDKKPAIQHEIEKQKQKITPILLARQASAMDIWSKEEKNTELKRLFKKVIIHIEDESGKPIVKNIECCLKIMELSAKLTGELIHNVAVRSEGVTYNFHVDRNA